jgi:adenosine deaminase
MCPISNVRTGVVASIEKHPVKDYYDKGLIVFVNTDDPEMFHNTMVDEYYECIDKLGFGMNDIYKLAENAIDSAWCENRTKQSLKTELNNYFKSNNISYD